MLMTLNGFLLYFQLIQYDDGSSVIHKDSSTVMNIQPEVSASSSSNTSRGSKRNTSFDNCCPCIRLKLLKMIKDRSSIKETYDLLSFSVVITLISF